MKWSKKELAKHISEVAVLYGDFLLRSGQRSNYYIDKYLFTSNPEILSELGGWFESYARQHNIQRLAGAELGGIPIVTAASLQTGLPAFYVRNKKKEYGSSKKIEGSFNKGDRVMLVEDICTTGGQIIEAANDIQSLGGQVDIIVSVIDREAGAKERINKAGFFYTCILTKSDLGI